MEDKKPKVEHNEDISDVETGKNTAQSSAAMGTVTLSDMADIFLIPTPSADPRGICSALDTANDGS